MNVPSKYVVPVNVLGLKREFHVSLWARKHYDLDEALFSLGGRALFADAAAAQRAALRINTVRDSARYPESAVKPGELYAAGLLDELLHLVLEIYRERINANIMAEAFAFLGTRVQGGEEALNKTLLHFAKDFPALSVYKGEQAAENYLNETTDNRPNRDIVLEELLLLWLSNENPALTRFADLFDDRGLEEHTVYPQMIKGLGDFFATQPPLLPDGDTLFEMLCAPMRSSPTSLEGQLEFIRNLWAPVLGEKFEILVKRLLTSISIMREEAFKGGPGGGPPPSKILDFSDETLAGAGDPAFRGRGGSKRKREEYERFSSDQSWMPRVVMLAKSTYVWLGQLSKQYGLEIERLDQIPDAELDELARRGFTSLWLIGLWERSEASKRIKRLRGQPDAVASAYSLYDYEIAHDLGGEAAYENLRDRAWERGVRLASDMVPNHFGIDSRWVVEHPDWFLQLDHPPYPGYTFNGPDLSGDERVGVYLEDHYYDSTDAAVVFKRRDHHTGAETYIYHGNDGTAMPWNDTAQLNYLSGEVREAIIQTILHVARKFSVIRFDAAMTLAKQHIQRIWFPEPGEGGSVPSRAQYGTMTAAELDKHIPQEFWREVVDRVAQEVPDTLLLAEAFWMMESYFVRTLGMHRVYNSAFMHMMMQEENAKYRQSVKNTLEFDPQILKRFVNFMNNPDEETAIAQFGKDDKYFGVAIVMSTMPGLPMFGHGQIEGYHEKYGMEYRRAKWDESPDEWLVGRHYQKLFPLLHRRAEFAEVENFLLYDLYGENGHVNENVYAYSNFYDGKASLVVYNNKFKDAKGWLKLSSSYRDKGNGELRQRELHDGLGLHGDDKHFAVFREHISGLEYLKPSREFQQQGMYIELGAFKYKVFLDVREVFDEDGTLTELHASLNDQGVPSIEEERALLRLRDLHKHFVALIETDKLNAETLDAFLAELNKEDISVKLSKVQLKKLESYYALPKPKKDKRDTRMLLRAYALITTLFGKEAVQRTQDLRLVRVLERTQTLHKLPDAYLLAHALPSLLRYAPSITTKTIAPALLKKLLADNEVASYLQVNVHDGVTWFKHEPFEMLSNTLVSAAQLGKEDKLTDLSKGLKAAEKRSKYQLDLLLPKPAKKATSKKTSARKPTAKKVSSKKSTVKKSTAEKATARKSATKKSATKKSAAKKTAAKKSADETNAKAVKTKAKKPTSKKGEATKSKLAKAKKASAKKSSKKSSKKKSDAKKSKS